MAAARSDVRVLMVGPDASGFGGMCTVVALFVAHVGPGSGVALEHVVTHRDGSAALRVRVFAVGALRYARRVFGHRCDVVHLHVSERGSVVRKALLLALARAARVPVVLHCHGAEFAQELALMGRPARWAVRAMFSRAAAVAVLGQDMAGTVVEAGAHPGVVRVVPNPVALPERVPQRERDDPVNLLFLGRMAQRKGAGDLVRALAALEPPVRSRVRLRMFGDGPVAEVRALVSQLGVGEVVFVGEWLLPAGRDLELAAAEVFVLPSHNEGLPMALLEAMAWGLAPVVTPVGGIPAVVTDHVNGLLVEPGDVGGLAVAIAELVGSDELRGQLARAARSTATGYDVRTYVVDWAREWSSLVPGPPASAEGPASGTSATGTTGSHGVGGTRPLAGLSAWSEDDEPARAPVVPRRRDEPGAGTPGCR